MRVNLWTSILEFAVFVFNYLVSTLPEVNPVINARILTFLNPIKTTLAPANYMFPVNTFFIVFGTIISIEAVIFTIKTIGWLIHVFTGGKFKGV